LNNKNHGLEQGLLLSALATLAILLPGVVWPDGLERAFIETDELRLIYYDPDEFHLVPHTTQSFLSALAAQKRLFGWVPDGHVSIFLKDLTDRGNASTYVAPRDQIDFEIAPSNEPYETFTSADRYASTAVHELTHVATMDGVSPVDARFRRFFHGKVEVQAAHPESLLYNYLTVPRATTPRWYLEGSAVFTETWMSGGVGRAQGGYDEMVFRAMVKDHARFYDPLGLVSKGTEIDFQTLGNAYLYGTRFMNYLALTYGPERLVDWWRRGPDSRRYYADDFQRVFGLPIAEVWGRWVDFEHSFQQQNLRAVREHPVSESHDLTHRELGAVSRSYLSADGSKLFTAIRYPGQVAHLVSIARSDGTVKELKEIRGPRGYTVTSLAYDPHTGTLFYTSNNNSYRNLEALDLRTGKSRMLLHAARIGDIVYNPADRSLWGLRFVSGFVVLVRIPFPYSAWQNLYVFPSREQAFDLDLSPDGTLASVSVSGPGPKPGSPPVTQVRLMRTEALLRHDATPLHVFSMGSAVPECFVFSPDGRYLFGSSFYTGVSNIYRYEIATGTLAAVSNADVGFFRPLPLDDSKLIVLRYSATGFVPTQIEAKPTEDLSAVTFLGEQVAEKHPEVQSWVAPTADSEPYDTQIVHKGPYTPARELSLEAVLPVVEGFENSKAVGVSARFSDPVILDWVTLDTSFSPDDALPSRERLHVSVNGHQGDWTGGLAWNGADFYDLFGPTKRTLAGYNGYLSYDRALIFDPPQTMDFLAKVAYYGDLDTLPGFQNVVSPTRNLFTAQASLVSSDTRSSPGAVDAETGHTWSLKVHGYGALGEFIPSVSGTFDIGFALPLDHSSIWLRSGAGVSAGTRADPLANLYLGGFGNNYVDSRANGGAQRYRDLLSFPGFELDALSGKSLAKSTLEWCLPPVRFEALGSPGFYVSWARPEIFVGTLETDPLSRDFRQNARDVGAQMDFQLHVMHRQPMMLSAGVARGFGEGGLGITEFMLSLEVL
jgi:hypothetical protein